MSLRMLIPALKFAEDFFLTMVKDDQRDIAYPAKYHRGVHHFQLGLIGFPFFRIAAELIDVLEIIKAERFHPNDTPASFLGRAIAIHNHTYKRPTDADSQDRLDLLHRYLDQLNGENNKKSIERKVENAIYMGKIKTKSQLNEELRRRKMRRKPMHPPRMPPRASQGKIMLSSTKNNR